MLQLAHVEQSGLAGWLPLPKILSFFEKDLWV